MADGQRDDEQFEVMFWWFGGDAQHSIEDGLDDFLDQGRRSRRRRLPWPGRRGPSLMLHDSGDNRGDEDRPVA